MTTLLFILPFLVIYTILVVYAERKISAFMQDRLGPMEVGYYGILQTVADTIKLIQKEDIIPAAADKRLFKIAPVIIFLPVFAGFSVLPLAPVWAGAKLSSGLFFMLAIISVDVIGLIIAGWASNNKYSLMGAFRSVAQIISYEIPVGLAVLSACVVCESLDLQEISYQQGILGNGPIYFLGIKAWDVSTVGGFLSWNVFRLPLLLPVWVIFFIATLAEANRAPFDLPEAESELVAGFQTEYSGTRFLIIMLGEYSMMLLVSFVGVILFWGSWNTVFPQLGAWKLAEWTTGTPGSLSGYAWGIFWIVSKTLGFVALQIWVRWTFPRVRIDQLMTISWKYLTPAALILLLFCAFWKLLLW